MYMNNPLYVIQWLVIHPDPFNIMYVIGSQVINIVIHTHPPEGTTRRRPTDRREGVRSSRNTCQTISGKSVFNHLSVILTQNLPNNITGILGQTHLSVIHPFEYGHP